MTTTSEAKLYSLSLRESRTYLIAAAFIVGNIALPQLCHLIPQGGFIFLPIYFFTMIAAYKYGLRVGLLTALLSPLVNCVLFSMPAPAMLPVIMVKGTLLAGVAALLAHRSGKASLLSLVAVVLGYQLLGSLVEWAITGSAAAALQDVMIGWPGMALQVVLGYVVLNFLLKK